jgi:hypothetical protein
LNEEDIQQIVMQPMQKAIVLVALAQRWPEQKKKLLELAGRLNYDIVAPRYFLDRAIAAENASL